MANPLPAWRSFRGKLNAVFVVLLVLVAGLGALGYKRLADVGDISDTVVGYTEIHHLAVLMASDLAAIESNLKDFIAEGDTLSRREVETNLADLTATLEQLQAKAAAGSPLTTDIDFAIAEAVSLTRSVRTLIAGAANGGSSLLLRSAFDHMEQVQRLFDEFNTRSLERVESEIVQQNNIASGLTFNLLLVGIAILVILLATSLYVRATVRSIGTVTKSAVAIASGDLEQVVPVHRRDEIGLLAGAFNSMTAQIRELIDGLEHRVADRTAELSAEIAERQHAEEELRHAKDFAETVLNSMTESIAIVDTRDFTITGANKVFLESAKVSSAADLVGLTCYAVTHKRDDPCCPPNDICPLIELKEGKPVASVEHTHYDADGNVHYAEVSVSPIPSDNGELRQVVHVSRDITERKKAEEQLREYADRLENALQELGQAQSQLLQAQKLEAIGGLAAGIAHEINTPIQYVADNTRFLQTAFDDLFTMQQRVDDLIGENGAVLTEVMRAEYDAAREDADLEYLAEEIPTAIEQAIDGTKRVAEIVRALKDFSHPGGDTKTPLDVNRLVTNTAAVCRNEWKYVAQLTTELDPAIPMVPALSGPLGQALLILIVNAAQAIGDNLDGDGALGAITVSTSTEGGMASIAVADTGPGIPEEIRQRVFEHFFTTKEVGKGSGQGLAIARSIVVDQHGGELDFTSTAGEGTTFFIRIPLEMAEAEAV